MLLPFLERKVGGDTFPDGGGMEVRLLPHRSCNAMRLGAFNYLIKPFTPDSIEAILEKAKEHHNLIAENTYFGEDHVADESRWFNSYRWHYAWWRFPAIGWHLESYCRFNFSVRCSGDDYRSTAECYAD